VIEDAYLFARHESGVHVTLAGTGSIDHLRQNAASINSRPLPPATLERLGALALEPTA
jgi:aryl-alcohol dehydrogenase-like predicted oxidoreductase